MSLQPPEWVQPRGIQGALALVGWVLMCLAAAAPGVLCPPGAWYAGLNKPTWNPPNWIFGPVWTALYVTMGTAAWLVWLRGGFRAQRLALGFFLTQLVLNSLWSPLFFGLQRPDLALLEIAVLWAAVVATMVAFWQSRRVAGMLLLPYLAWVSFATWLNFTLWRLNP